jgi:hypothetical protein
MTQFQQLISSLHQQAAASLHRSDVLKPLAWLIGILILGALGSAYQQAPVVLTFLLGGAAAAAVMLYFAAYIFWGTIRLT